MDRLSARNLRKWGMRRGAYDGANKRRFVLFYDNHNGTESRREFDSKRERDLAAHKMLDSRIAFEAHAQGRSA